MASGDASRLLLVLSADKLITAVTSPDRSQPPTFRTWRPLVNNDEVWTASLSMLSESFREPVNEHYHFVSNA